MNDHATTDNTRAVIGGNQPTPFDLSQQEIDDLFDEAKNWLDGSGIASQADADGVSKLLDMVRKARKRADEARAEEKRPHDEAAAAVQKKWTPLLSRADLATDACKKALTPWLDKLDREQKAEAERLRREAEEKARRAQEAIRASRDGSLEEREEAEALLQHAKDFEAVAKRAEKTKAHAKGGARAVTLKTTYRPVLRSPREAAAHYWAARKDEFDAFLLSLAEKDVRAGKREIPGFEIKEEKGAV